MLFFIICVIIFYRSSNWYWEPIDTLPDIPKDDWHIVSDLFNWNAHKGGFIIDWYFNESTDILNSSLVLR